MPNNFSFSSEIGPPPETVRNPLPLFSIAPEQALNYGHRAGLIALDEAEKRAKNIFYSASAPPRVFGSALTGSGLKVKGVDKWSLNPWSFRGVLGGIAGMSTALGTMASGQGPGRMLDRMFEGQGALSTPFSDAVSSSVSYGQDVEHFADIILRNVTGRGLYDYQNLWSSFQGMIGND